MTHICVSKLTIIGSDNGLSPGRRQAIIWTNGEILLIGPLGTNFSEISIKIQTFSFKKMRLRMSSGKRRPFYLSLNVLKSTSKRNEERMRDNGWRLTSSASIGLFSIQRGSFLHFIQNVLVGTTTKSPKQTSKFIHTQQSATLSLVTDEYVPGTLSAVKLLIQDAPNPEL